MQQQIQKLNVKFNHFLRKNFPEIQRYDFEEIRKDIDEFIEVLLGKTGFRTDLMGNKNIRLIDLSSTESLKREVEGFKGYLVSLNDNAAMKKMSNTDLYNVRDTILGDMNQFLYLLTFK